MQRDMRQVTMLVLLFALLASVEAQCAGGTAMSGADGACGLVNNVGTCCSNNACCSQYGYCGTTTDHCGVTTGDGKCQVNFGRCNYQSGTACTAGQTWSQSGNSPCSNCATCPNGLSPTTQCTATSNTVCPAACVAGQTWSSTGYAPCQSCSTCPNGIGATQQCSATSNTVCPAACVAGTSWSSTGYAPCQACTTCSGTPTQQCTKTTNAVCPNATPCVAGSTWSSTGNAPCNTCTTCPSGVTPSTQCTKTTNAACPPACVAGTSWSSTGYSPCQGCSSCSTGSPTTQCTKTSNTVCPVACVLGSTWSASGNAPCQSCTTCAGGASPTTACKINADAVCPTSTCVISTDTACGSNGAGKCCPSGNCCSQYGWCGTTDAHCKTGCQSAFGICADSGTTTPCVQGTSWSASGNSPCQSCSTCTNNATPTSACTKTSNTVCPAVACVAGQTWSASGNSPCNTCSTCSSGVRNACATTKDTECNPVQCVAGKTWSASGNAPCKTCTSCSKTSQACSRTTDTVCAASDSTWGTAIATCFGDYSAVFGFTSSVKSGFTNQLPWMSWAYATAAKPPWSQWAGQCYAVKCLEGQLGNTCKPGAPTIMIRTIDQLGTTSHEFDINTVGMQALSVQGCNGQLKLAFKPISCNYPIGPTMNQIVANDGTVQSGIAAVISSGSCDSWQPRWLFDNAAAGIASIVARTSLGTHTLTRFDGEFGAWKTTTGAGQWNNLNVNGNEITFTIDYCDFSRLPAQCVPAGAPIDAILPAGWCPGGGICPAGYYMLSPAPKNFAAIFPVTTGALSSAHFSFGILVSVTLAVAFALV